MKFEPRNIYCMKCSRKVATWDGRSSNNISVRCRKCNLLVEFDVKTQKTELKKLPPRKTSSGMTFI